MRIDYPWKEMTIPNRKLKTLHLKNHKIERVFHRNPRVVEAPFNLEINSHLKM